MAVIVKYIVVRNGEEKMTFATKKEADAYDKMLDIADNLFDFLEKSDIKLNESTLEQISLYMAENRMELVPMLRGIKPPAKKATPKPAAKKAAPKPAAKKVAPASRKTAPAKPAKKK